MKLNVARLRRTVGGTENYSLREDFSSIQLGEDEYYFQSPVEARLIITNTGKSLLAKGTVHCRLGAVCSRCLKDFPYELSFDFEDQFIPAEFYSVEDEEGAFVFEKDEFTIDDRIREHILLHLPMRFICSDSCKGLCSRCGTDLNVNSCSCADGDIDPRLEILSKWNKGV